MERSIAFSIFAYATREETSSQQLPSSQKQREEVVRIVHGDSLDLGAGSLSGQGHAKCNAWEWHRFADNMHSLERSNEPPPEQVEQRTGVRRAEQQILDG